MKVSQNCSVLGDTGIWRSPSPWVRFRTRTLSLEARRRNGILFSGAGICLLVSRLWSLEVEFYLIDTRDGTAKVN